MRVLVVDDHPGVRAALRVLLEDHLGAQVVAEAHGGDEAIRLADELHPDLVLMDVSMPNGLSGVEATRAITNHGREGVRVTALTAAQDGESVAAMVAAGADSYLVKTAPPDELLEELRQVLAGRTVLAPDVVPEVLRALRARLAEKQQRVEQLEELDRVKREFISLVSDHLQNPLTAITGCAKTLLTGWDRLDEATARELIGRMERQADQLTYRLGQVLSVGRLQTGGQALADRFTLDALVRETLVRMAPAIGDRVVEQDTQPVEVVADRSGIANVLAALVDNALTHTAGQITVRTLRRDGEAVAEVIDDGPGIPPEVALDSGTELFAPGDPSTTREGRGLGLSLPIARRILQAADGRLEFDTPAGGGTAARIILPAR